MPLYTVPKIMGTHISNTKKHVASRTLVSASHRVMVVHVAVRPTANHQQLSRTSFSFQLGSASLSPSPVQECGASLPLKRDH